MSDIFVGKYPTIDPTTKIRKGLLKYKFDGLLILLPIDLRWNSPHVCSQLSCCVNLVLYKHKNKFSNFMCSFSPNFGLCSFSISSLKRNHPLQKYPSINQQLSQTITWPKNQCYPSLIISAPLILSGQRMTWDCSPKS